MRGNKNMEDNMSQPVAMKGMMSRSKSPDMQMHRSQMQAPRKTTTALESYPEGDDRAKNSRAPLPNRRSPATR